MVQSSPSKRVVAFGEAMIRLTPPGNERLERSISLDLSPGGAELNTAVTLACLGLHAQWISRLPENNLARYLDRQAKAHDVDMNGVSWVPESHGRMGLYFLEEGTDPRPSAVTYDRANSAFARLKPGEFDWPAIFEGAAAFHLSGITPAVSEASRKETMRALKAASNAGVPVFFDLNYRSKLWSESEARECFQELIPMVNVLFAGRNSLRKFYGLDGNPEEIMKAARKKLNIDACVLTRKRPKGSTRLKIRGAAVGPSGKAQKTEWKSIDVVDRLGGGDAFAGGFIAGYLEDSSDLSRALDLGVAASALKHTMPGDFLCATAAEIEAAAAETESGVLQR